MAGRYREQQQKQAQHLQQLTLCFPPDFLHSVAGAALIATGSSYMAASIPLLMAVIFGLQYVYLRTSRQLRLLDLENRSPLYSHFLESLSGLSIIRAFGWEKENVEKNVRLLDFSQRPYYLLFCVQRWLNLVLDLIVAAEAVLVVGLALGLRGSTTAGLLGVSLNNILCGCSIFSVSYPRRTC
ncbi:hypothetical protein VTK73DRAFT_2124 [Phialemonium thermophilum]|uniref:ABC transmembrane type-1 domain-containing protein n=1 Tax=Phialemonium thermophilum TaxID=223376 RepID=A0ABR3VSL3_9PEZI